MLPSGSTKPNISTTNASVDALTRRYAKTLCLLTLIMGTRSMSMKSMKLSFSQMDPLRIHTPSKIDYENMRIHTPSKIDYENMRPDFGFLPLEIIKQTFRNSIQYGYMPASSLGNVFKRFKAPNPAMNVFRLNEDTLTDTVYANTPALVFCHTLAQIFFGSNSHITAIYGIKSTKNFLQTLQDFVRKWGAPNRVITDHVNYESSGRVLDYLHMLRIGPGIAKQNTNIRTNMKDVSRL